MRKIVVLIMSLMVGSAFAASTHLSLDNRTGMWVAAATERIVFSPAWETDAMGATAVVSTNGVVVKSAIEAGVFDWTPAQDGVYQLTHAVYVNGVQVGETLTATFVKGVAPRGCDWSTGTIELGWYADAKSLNAITYNIYWSESDDPASCVGKEDHRVGTKVVAPSKIGVQELTISDDKYLTHGDGLKPIYYHVVGTDGSKSFCKTRNRYALVVGISEYGWGTGGPKPMPNAASQAISFKTEFAKSCEKSENVICMTNSEVKEHDFRNCLTNRFAACAQSGDVFVLFIYSHGGVDKNTKQPGIVFYDKNAWYGPDEMAEDVLNFNAGVGFVGILYNCHAGAFLESDSDSIKWLEGTALATCTPNRAWICAADSTSSTPTDIFGWFLTEAGWKGGWADQSWENGSKRDAELVTFGALSRYTKQRMHDLIGAELHSEPEIFDDFKMLDNVVAGKRGSHPDMGVPQMPGISVSSDGSALGVNLNWSVDAVADGYVLYWHAFLSTKYAFEQYAATSFSAHKDSVAGYAFHIKAYNGAGVATSLETSLAKEAIKSIGGIIYRFVEVPGIGTVLGSITLENSWAFAPKTIDVPSSCDGADVVGVTRQAFDDVDDVEEVRLPDTLTTIEAGTFDRCVNLKSVIFNGDLPEGIEDSGVFDYVTFVRYPRKYAALYETVVPSELFAGYTDDVGEELAIETKQLPSVMEMEEYEEQLECSGGTEPYWWSMDEADYLTVAEESTFAEVGEAQGWREDDGEWRYDLPFAFNFGGRVYDSVVVHDNACLYFAMGSNTDAIETNLGDLYSESADQDIFVERAADHVTFRWKRVLYSDRGSDVNCSITLNADGTIRCSFGDSSYYSRQVWLSTARDGAEAEQSGDDDIVFVPNYLPLGLWLDEETGVIYGAPEQAGHYAFNVYVSDDEGTISSKRMTLDVETNPNLRPVVEDWGHVDGRLILRGGESRTFSVSVSDPEGEALTYRWYYDGHVVQGATGPSFVLQTDVDMRGWHSLICEASDGLWFVDAGTWSFAIGGEQFVTSEDGADALQVAVDNAVDGDVIYVGPGTYSSIEVPWCERVRIVATDGCANTIIDGGRTASCVSVAYAGGETNRMVRIEGFTLQDGCADMGGGARYAWLVGCVVLGNVADNYGGGLCYGRADNCLIVGNSAQYGGGACWAALYNCTVVGNAAYTYGGGINSCGDIANTIVWGNYQDDELEWFTTVNGDPLFVDSENLDFRLAEGSPCIGMGDNSLVATARDLAGNVRIQGGSVDLGAYESAYALPRPQDSTGLWVSPRTDMIRLEWSDVTYAKFYKVYRVKDELDDSQAKLIGTTDQLWFDDRSAWHDVTYRYWVVACNEMGDGPVGDYAWGALLDPLEIVDSELPAGVVGKPYEHTLEARGGDESYEWRVLAFSPDVEKNSGVPQAGVPMGWVEDDGCWSFELPFEFPVGTGGTKEVEVSDNGYLTLSDGDEYVTLYAAYDVDLYADPGDVYVTVGQDSVTFRWERVIYGTDEAVNVSATLYADGSVRLGDYDNSSDVVFRGYETGRDDACLDVSGDIILRPNVLPRGLELGEDGTLSGVPQKGGVFQFLVAVIDGNREYGLKEFSLHITGEMTDPIPDLGSNPTVGEVREALEGSADDRLQTNITDGENYNAYRNWATTVKNENGSGLAGAQAVRMSPYAWVSFATDSAALLAKMPTDDDLKVEEFKPSAMAGAFDFTVSVKDVTIGDKASVDNLKKLFGLEGAESLDSAAFSSDNVALEFKEPQDGKLKFTATPAVDDAKSFFMKAKVK